MIKRYYNKFTNLLTKIIDLYFDKILGPIANYIEFKFNKICAIIFITFALIIPAVGICFGFISSILYFVPSYPTLNELAKQNQNFIIISDTQCKK